jgi:hypothetical protein
MNRDPMRRTAGDHVCGKRKKDREEDEKQKKERKEKEKKDKGNIITFAALGPP